MLPDVKSRQLGCGIPFDPNFDAGAFITLLSFDVANRVTVLGCNPWLQPD